MTHLLYYAPNERYDRLMRDINAMDLDTLASANGGSLRAIAKLLHREDLPMLRDFVRENPEIVKRGLSDYVPLL